MVWLLSQNTAKIKSKTCLTIVQVVFLDKSELVNKVRLLIMDVYAFEFIMATKFTAILYFCFLWHQVPENSEQ